MKKKILCLFVPLLFGLVMFAGCDPVLPDKGITATIEPNPLPQGTSALIHIVYPDTKNTAVENWNDPGVSIVSGHDIVAVNGLSVTGLKPGTAALKIKVTTNNTFLGAVVDHTEFTSELTVVVK